MTFALASSESSSHCDQQKREGGRRDTHREIEREKNREWESSKNF
jgi:hypothetical protein